MSYHWIIDRYQDRPAAFYVKESDGGEEIGVQDFGSVFQLVDEGLLRRMDSYGKAVFNHHWRPLGRKEYSMRASWYIRRGRRFWPWQVAWWAASAWEQMNGRSLGCFYWLLWKDGQGFGGEMMSWNGLLRRLNQENA